MLWNYLCMAGQPNGSPHISACIVRALYLFHTHTHTHRVHVSICWLWLSLRENLVRQCRRSFEPEINDKRNENQICAKEIEICIRWVKRSVCVCRRLLIAFGISYWEKNCSMVCVCIEWVSSYELPLYVFVFTVHIDRPNEKNEKKNARTHQCTTHDTSTVRYRATTRTHTVAATVFEAQQHTEPAVYTHRDRVFSKDILFRKENQ